MNPLALFLPFLLLPGPPVVSPAPATVQAAPPLEWRAQYHGDEEAGAQVVMDAWHWGHLWRRLGQSAPPLDFTRYCAVVAFAGRRPTGGFTLEFQEPVPQGDDLLLRWRVRPPAPGSFVTEAIAHPWKVWALPRPKGGIRVERAKE